MRFLYLWAKLLKKIRGSAIVDTRLGKDSKVEAGSHLVEVLMGRHSFCGYDCEIYHCDIGKFCSIGNYVRIGGSRHPYEWVSTSPVFYAGRDSIKEKFSEFARKEEPKTYIGNDVWIGEGAYIKAGISIGDGSVIGMGSVVTKNVEPYTIVAGNPARLIRYRFEKSICKELQKIEWWNLDEPTLRKLSMYIREPEKFIKLYNEMKKEMQYGQI